MYAAERQDSIERLLIEEGRVGVVDLARRFDVTTETIRRDLDQLEAAGALRRVHGGAMPRERASTVEPTLTERMLRHGPAKSAIGQRAADVLDADFRGSVYFDAGTTTAAVAAALAPRLGSGRIEAVTHALTVGGSLAQIPGLALTAIGGRVRGATAAAVGAGTVREISSLRPDIAFIGTNGISAGFGLSTPDPDEAAVKSAIVAAARIVVVVADSDKFDTELLVRFAGLADIDILVTDAAPPAGLAAALAENDVEVRVA